MKTIRGFLKPKTNAYNLYMDYIFARSIYTIVQTIHALYKQHFNAYPLNI